MTHRPHRPSTLTLGLVYVLAILLFWTCRDATFSSSAPPDPCTYVSCKPGSDTVTRRLDTLVRTYP